MYCKDLTKFEQPLCFFYWVLLGKQKFYRADDSEQLSEAVNTIWPRGKTLCSASIHCTATKIELNLTLRTNLSKVTKGSMN